MSKKKTGAVKVAPIIKKELSFEEKELIVEEMIGVKPRYLIKRGFSLELDRSKLQEDGKQFTDWNHTEHYYL